MARRTRIPAALAFLAACIAGGQPVPTRQPDLRPIDPRPVDAGVEDVSPLQRSLRTVPLDLRLDSGFSRVLELDRPTRLVGPGAPRVFARRSGAITAIFPESSYSWSNDGRVVIEVPAGTVYQIGDMPRTFEYDRMSGLDYGLEYGPAAITGVDLRADLAAPARTIPTARGVPAPNAARAGLERTGSERTGSDRQEPTPVVPTARTSISLWTDDEYRAHRVSALLDAAARREASGANPMGGPTTGGRPAGGR